MGVTAFPTANEAPKSGLLHWLDDRPVVGSWQPTLSAVLLDIAAKLSHADLVALRRLERFVSLHRSVLATNATSAERVIVTPAEEAKAVHPVGTTLLMRRTTRASISHGLDLLIAAMCEAALEACSKPERDQIAKMTQTLRGPLETAPNSRLQMVLGDSQTLTEVYSRLERNLDSKESHPTFAAHWRRWFRDRVHAWLFFNRGRLLHALEPNDLVPPEDSPEITIQSDPEAEPDDTLDVPIAISEPASNVDEIASHKTEGRRARAMALERASEGDLLSHPDGFLPEEIIARIARGAIAQAKRHLATGAIADSEPYAALALSIAAGVRPSDIADIHWGDDDATTIVGPSLRLSVSRSVIYRPVVRPPSSAKPKPELIPHLGLSVDVIEWPIPPGVHDLLRSLAGSEPKVGTCAIPVYDRGVDLPIALHDVIARLEPGLYAGTNSIRRALAAELSRLLGPDVAQLALGDTFSHSSAPTYYSAQRVSSLVAAVSSIHRRWFGECADLPPPGGSFGSRIILTSQSAKEWPSTLIRCRRSAAHRNQNPALDAWCAHRDFLGASLSAATGHRPVDSIATINLHDVIPEYGVVVLHDKQIDPLRRTRVAATGARWTVELREYLDRLIELSNSTDTRVSTIAKRILQGDEPLLTAATPNGESTFDSAALASSMPPALQTTRNHYRHRLNQQMQWRGVDPELRFGQMGWVVSPAHFMADLAPNAAIDLARLIGPVIDDILLEDGWFPGSQRISPWRWDGVPMPVLKDWDIVAREHERDHKQDVKRLRTEWKERGKEAQKDVIPRLADAICSVVPMLRLDEKESRLVRAPDFRGKDAVEIDNEQCELIVAMARNGSARKSEALETATARILLHRLLKKSHRQELTSGALPWRPMFGAAAGASPFLDGMGRAVRHANVLREVLRDRLRAGTSRDQGILTVLSILSWSPYRDVELACAAVEQASHAVRASNPGDWVRIPASLANRSHPMVLNGVPAVLIARRGQESPTAHAPSPEKIEAWLQRHFPLAAQGQGNLLPAVTGLLRAVGRLELSGQERTLMLRNVQFSGAPVERCLATDDNWPARTRESERAETESVPGTVFEAPVSDRPTSTSNTLNEYKRLTSLLNPESLARTLDKDNRYGLAQAFAASLKTFREEVEETSSVGLLAGFALNRLRHRGNEQISLYTYVTRFGGDLLKVAGTRQLLQMSATDLHRAYMAVLLGQSADERPQTLAPLRWFQEYLEDVYQVEEVPFGELAAKAGARIKSSDPGIVSDAEADAIDAVLQTDLTEEITRTDASPDFVRIAELTRLRFIFLDASGLRPDSVHGLLISDIHLLGEGRDFVHVHKTGSYGAAKTKTSVGFIPLTGNVWVRNRKWVADWLVRERKNLIDHRDSRSPLFAQKAGTSRRYSKTYLGQRIGQVVRWACDDTKARPYWLRKRRIRIRHHDLASRQGLCLARDVHHILVISGHAGIITPFESYIGDSAIPVAHSLREARQTSRADILLASQLKPEPLDVAWGRRGGPAGANRMEVVFGRLPFASAAAPQARMTAAPPTLLRRRGLLPKDIDVFARAMQKENDRELASLKAGLSVEQANALDHAAAILVRLHGRVPWEVPGLIHPRAVMRAARRFKGSMPLFKALEKPPSTSLQRLAQVWATQGFANRLGNDSTLLLSDDADIAAATEVIREIAVDARRIQLQKKGQATFLNFRPDSVGRRSRSLAATLEWVLAVVWIQQKITDGL